MYKQNSFKKNDTSLQKELDINDLISCEISESLAVTDGISQKERLDALELWSGILKAIEEYKQSADKSDITGIAAKLDQVRQERDEYRQRYESEMKKFAAENGYGVNTENDTARIVNGRLFILDVSEWNEKAKEFDIYIQMLEACLKTKQNEQLEQIVQEKSIEIKLLGKECAKQREDLRNAEEQTAILLKEKQDYKTKIEESDKQCRDLLNYKGKLEKIMTGMEFECEKARKSESELKAKLYTANRELADHKEKEEVHVLKLKALQVTQEELEKDRLSNAEQIKHLEMEKSKVTKEISDFKERATALENAIRLEQEQASVLRESIEDLSFKRKATESKLKSAVEELENSQKSAAELKEQLNWTIRKHEEKQVELKQTSEQLVEKLNIRNEELRIATNKAIELTLKQQQTDLQLKLSQEQLKAEKEARLEPANQLRKEGELRLLWQQLQKKQILEQQQIEAELATSEMRNFESLIRNKYAAVIAQIKTEYQQCKSQIFDFAKQKKSSKKMLVFVEDGASLGKDVKEIQTHISKIDNDIHQIKLMQKTLRDSNFSDLEGPRGVSSAAMSSLLSKILEEETLAIKFMEQIFAAAGTLYSLLPDYQQVSNFASNIYNTTTEYAGSAAKYTPTLTNNAMDLVSLKYDIARQKLTDQISSLSVSLGYEQPEGSNTEGEFDEINYLEAKDAEKEMREEYKQALLGKITDVTIIDDMFIIQSVGHKYIEEAKRREKIKRSELQAKLKDETGVEYEELLRIAEESGMRFNFNQNINNVALQSRIAFEENIIQQLKEQFSGLERETTLEGCFNQISETFEELHVLNDALNEDRETCISKMTEQNNIAEKLLVCLPKIPEALKLEALIKENKARIKCIRVEKELDTMPEPDIAFIKTLEQKLWELKQEFANIDIAQLEERLRSLGSPMELKPPLIENFTSVDNNIALPQVPIEPVLPKSIENISSIALQDPLETTQLTTPEKQEDDLIQRFEKLSGKPYTSLETSSTSLDAEAYKEQEELQYTLEVHALEQRLSALQSNYTPRNEEHKPLISAPEMLFNIDSSEEETLQRILWPEFTNMQRELQKLNQESVQRIKREKGEQCNKVAENSAASDKHAPIINQRKAQSKGLEYIS